MTDHRTVHVVTHDGEDLGPIEWTPDVIDQAAKRIALHYTSGTTTTD